MRHRPWCTSKAGDSTITCRPQADTRDVPIEDVAISFSPADHCRAFIAASSSRIRNRSPSPGQVNAVIRRVICGNHNLSGKQMLNSQVPLINLWVPHDPRVQITAVVEAPIRQLAISPPLRRRQTCGERVRQRCVLSYEIVVREMYRRKL